VSISKFMWSEMGSLLIIDDDTELCYMLRMYLGDYGFSLDAVHDAESGLRALTESSYDLLILDVMLPGFDGFTLLRELRTHSQIGVIMLTARAHEEDRIQGFDSGADDYVPKPFNARELLGRIQALLRRSTLAREHSAVDDMFVKSSSVLRLDSTKRKAFFRERAWHLTETEFLLLRAFLESQGKVINREDLVEQVFQREFHPLDRGLDMHISRLRRKLETMGCPPDWIKTIRNSGYLFSSDARIAS
jgi:two-component system, OmpR family, response regulator CpxR